MIASLPGLFVIKIDFQAICIFLLPVISIFATKLKLRKVE